MPRPTLFDHPKFLRLAHDLGISRPATLGHLEFVWRIGYASGNPTIGDEVDVEIAAEWDGEPGKFAAACERIGFLDRNGSGKLSIHDLDENSPKYVKDRRYQELKRKEKGRASACIGDESATVGDESATNRKKSYTPSPSPAPAPFYNDPSSKSSPSSALLRVAQKDQCLFATLTEGITKRVPRAKPSDVLPELVAALVVNRVISEHMAIDAAEGTFRCHPRNPAVYFWVCLRNSAASAGIDLTAAIRRVRLPKATAPPSAELKAFLQTLEALGEDAE